MIGSRFHILLCAVGGLLLGLLAYQCQSPHLPMMNSCGVLAFVSMGASLGCLISRDGNNR
jgi:hypothetical protein